MSTATATRFGRHRLGRARLGADSGAAVAPTPTPFRARRMRPFHPSMFPHRVYLLRRTVAKAAGRTEVESFSAPSGDPLPCRVRFSGRAVESKDTGVAVTPVAIAFPADPGSHAEDVFLRDGLRFRSIARPEARDGDGVLFVVPCQLID